jgi:hypothetical protein
MHLTTHAYTIPPAQPELMEPIEYGWPGVRNGLHSILIGYLIIVGMGILAALLAWYVIMTAMYGETVAAFLDLAMVLYAGLGILFLLGLSSLTFIVKGNIACLINAPERCGARWLMFSSTLCVIVGPALNFASGFVGARPKRPPAQVKLEAAAEVNQALRAYADSLKMRDARAYTGLVGDVSSLLSGVFFVLFLRAVARCFNDVGRMRIAEAYLIFGAVLFGLSVYLFLNPLQALANPTLLLALGGGWLLSVVWYLLLLISISFCIAEGLARRRSPLDVEPRLSGAETGYFREA